MPLTPQRLGFNPDDDFEDADADDGLDDIEIDPDRTERGDDGEDDDGGKPKRRDDRDDEDDGSLRGGRRRREAKGRDDEDDDEGYSVRVRKRIARLRAQKGESDRALAVQRAENAKLREQVNRATTSAIDSSVSSLEKARKDLLEKIAAAKEGGDTKLEVELEDELADVRERLRSAKYHKSRAAATRGDDDTGADDGGKPRGQGQPAKLRKITRDFLDEVGFEDWKPSDKALLGGIDAELAAEEDLTPDDPEYYDELRRRMRKRAPHLFDEEDLDEDDDDPPPRRKRRTPASAGGRESASRSDLSGSTVRITAQDKRVMRTLKLDPNDKDHLRQFAAEKRARLRDERANRRDRDEED